MTGLVWINHILNNASARLLALEETGSFASELHVPSDVYRSFQYLRRREIANGLPLIVLGASVVEDPTLTRDEFQVVP
ncbi:hypothetical protein I1A62_04045 (plasmid) [Rhodococcus sp. USK10]|uniref:hypothetical protein n=1 Tax=Rhodococcus sp. USK10 TaxID=2789739 RepID=UPI001C5F8AB0|nr:hypothetical protein [Rhodococcus sp. USK10]QYB00240.1 hypothetical protein I1A62_04045 [Rhodococcus sp. USK10]